MFTGIITDIGAVAALRRDLAGVRMDVQTSLDLSDAEIGASVACAGVCLTIVDKDARTGRFAADISAETLSKTTLGDLDVGDRLNLERALRVGDELGGHIVSGHVDGVAELIGTRDEGESTRWRLSAPRALGGYIAPKGSVALDGCSLTVNEVEDDPSGAHPVVFGVNLIPHTKAHTTFGEASSGRRLNLEIDVLARYVSRMTTFGG